MHNLRTLQLLVFEAGEGCNLASMHTLCPAHAGDRFRTCDAPPMTDEQVVDSAVTCVLDYGFHGLICFHFYNEPMLYIDRIERITAAIRERAPSARFGLWTNGTICPTPDQASLFSRAWVSRYPETKRDSETACKRSLAFVAKFDDRTTSAGSPTCCWRPYIELIFDARGYARLCCQAYKHGQSIGSLHNESVSDIVGRFLTLREQLKLGMDGAPGYCSTCGQSIPTLYSAHPRVAVVSLVKNEIDIMPYWYDHYRQLADLIIVTDNGSADGTREWLSEMQSRDDMLVVIDEPNQEYRQAEWTNRMIDMARELGCGWAIPADADEIFVLNGGRDGLDGVLFELRESNAIMLQSYVYRCTQQDDEMIDNPLQRMRYREKTPASIWEKVMVKTAPNVRVVLGNHFAEINGARINAPMLPDNMGRICHYNERSWDHYRRKIINGGEMMVRLIKAGVHPQRTAYQWCDPYNIYSSRGLPELWRVWDNSVRSAKNMIYDPIDCIFAQAQSKAPAQPANVTPKPAVGKLYGRVHAARECRKSAGKAAQRGDTPVHIVSTAYRIPHERIHAWFGWHDGDGWPATLVTDPDTAAELAGKTPTWCSILPYAHAMERFSLARTSNSGIRHVVDSGFAGCIVKTDIDVRFLEPFTAACTLLSNKRVLVPHYRMGKHEDDERAGIWAATCGTIAALSCTWTEICGYDERQDGYGVEDGDCLDRFRRAGYHIDRMQQVLHIAHDIGPQKYNARNDQWNRDSINPENHAHNQAVRRELWKNAEWGRS